MSESKGSSYVFIKDKEFGWRPAVQEAQEGTTAICSVPNYPDEQSMAQDGGRAAKGGSQVKVNLKDYPAQVLPLQNVDAQGQALTFPDMVKLPYLHEAGILYNMKQRHIDGKPYTRTGDIVIAVNPFQWFTELYTENKRVYYSNKIVWEPCDGDPRDNLEPHIYEVSSLCYKGLAFGLTDQSILVSGESGAGKTETVKIAMNHMASVQRGPRELDFAAGDSKGDDMDPVVARVVQSNPLLEAFGNASTRRNDNSSRFGKYLQLQFDNAGARAGGVITTTTANCKLAGSKCDVYLLEKNRVTGHDEKERTYHIFYQIIAAPDDEKASFFPKMKGTDRMSFKYVGPSADKLVEKKTDDVHWKETVETLAMVNVKDEKLALLMRAIIIVLLSGNVTFGAKDGDKDKSEITSPKSDIDDLAGLLGVGEEDLALAFTERTMKTKTETYKVPLNTTSAKEAADSFAKEVYQKVFLWVVKEINAATRAEDNYKDGTMTDFGIIGLLDIFGFESFVRNRFEQLCINYANEKLQQKFTEDVFRAVQLEYEAEGISLDQISYDDNSDVLDLIESRTGLLAMLNEECIRPKGSDQDFVQKALSQNKKSPCLLVNKTNRMSFGVHHYAGKVMYDAEGFVASNQETLPPDLTELMSKSANEIVSKNQEPEKKAADAPERKAPRRAKSNLASPTVWAKYKVQLGELMGNLRKTNSRYIRCVKPNMKKVPWVMQHIPTVEQLRCAGVVAAVTLARSAFPNRLDNSAVRFRYGPMWDKGKFPSKKTDSMSKEEQMKCDCEAILACVLEGKEYTDKQGVKRAPYAVGRTKSFFRAGALEFLEANRAEGLDGQAVLIQKIGRGFITRKRTHALLRGKAEAEKAAREEAERLQREKEEAEARAKAEKEAALAAAAAEREAKRKADEEQAATRIADARQHLEDAEEEAKQRMQELRDKKAAAEEEIERLKEETGEEARKQLMEPKKLAAQQKKKLEENSKMIEYLKKENKKIRKEHDKIKTKYDKVKDNNEKLIEKNEDTGNDFDDLNDATSRVHAKNEELTTTLETAKKDNKDLKEKCMAKQEMYMAQAECRLEYQKTMAKILNMIQEKVKNHQLVEDTVVIALECESEAKTIMAELEAMTS